MPLLIVSMPTDVQTRGTPLSTKSWGVDEGLCMSVRPLHSDVDFNTGRGWADVGLPVLCARLCCDLETTVIRSPH
jgi:hypothetical protein